MSPISYVILSVSEISHRTIALPNKLSLRGSIATAAISREGELPQNFIPYRHFVPLPPKEETKLFVIAKERSDCGNPLE